MSFAHSPPSIAHVIDSRQKRNCQRSVATAAASTMAAEQGRTAMNWQVAAKVFADSAVAALAVAGRVQEMLTTRPTSENPEGT